MKTELKPCPFCGRAASADIVHLNRASVIRVGCSNTFSCPIGPFIREEVKESDVDRTLLAFKKQWNTRAADPVKEKLVDALGHAKCGLGQLADRRVHWYIQQAEEALAAYNAEKEGL